MNSRSVECRNASSLSSSCAIKMTIPIFMTLKNKYVNESWYLYIKDSFKIEWQKLLNIYLPVN